MAFSLAPFLGDGSELNPFRPGVDGSFGIIDLRADSTQQAGWCLLTAESVPSGAVDLGPGLEDRIPRGISRNLENHLGVTLDQTSNLRAVIAELLILHGDSRATGRTRWRPLKADRRGMNRIVLGGELVFEAPAPVGATITDDFNRADQSGLGSSSGGWSWSASEVWAGTTWTISTNRALPSSGGLETAYRAEIDLDSANQFAQVEVVAIVGSTQGRVGPVVRFEAPGGDNDAYFAWWRSSGDGQHLRKRLGSTLTDLATATVTFPSLPFTERLEVDGSNLSFLVDSVEQLSATDTDITGNLRVGIMGAREYAGDNFEAGDLGAAFDPADLLATGTQTIVDVVNEADNTTDLHLSVDDDPATPDDGDWVNNAVDVVP